MGGSSRAGGIPGCDFASRFRQHSVECGAVVKLAVHHHGPDRAGRGDVLEGVAVQQDEIGGFAGLDRAVAVELPEPGRASARGGGQRLSRRETFADEEAQFVMQADAG